MYAAFWIDPTASDPNKRVVFCRPYAKKPNTAWFVLRSAIRESRTGGVLAGPEEDLNACVAAIDQKDDGWPDDAERMVAGITKIAGQFGCTVIFRQNLEPDGAADYSEAWASLSLGDVRVTELEDGAVVFLPLVGTPDSVSASLTKAEQLGWKRIDTAACQKTLGTTTLTLMQNTAVQSRAGLAIEYALARSDKKRNSAGFSQEVKLPFEKLDDVFDTMLGPTAKPYKFVLLIRERPNSILFFGTKPAQTVRQAIEQYVDHLNDRPSSAEPKSSSPDSSADDIFDEIAAPSVTNCRFWKL